MSLTVKTTSRAKLNRAALDEVQTWAADGLFAIAVQIVEAAVPNDAAPYGKGLLEGGGAVAWFGRKKVNGTTIGGKQIKKPRDLKLVEGQATAIAGFGFPARFHELGTVDTQAYPFLTPAANEVLPGANATISKAMARRLSGRRLGPGDRDR